MVPIAKGKSIFPKDERPHSLSNPKWSALHTCTCEQNWVDSGYLFAWIYVYMHIYVCSNSNYRWDRELGNTGVRGAEWWHTTSKPILKHFFHPAFTASFSCLNERLSISPQLSYATCIIWLNSVWMMIFYAFPSTQGLWELASFVQEGHFNLEESHLEGLVVKNGSTILDLLL